MIYISSTSSPLSPKQQSAKAREMLREALREEYGLDELPAFDVADGGKPSLHGFSDIHFNISHCPTAVAVAVDAEPVGIDIESVRRYRPEVARRIMSAEDIRRIEASDTPDTAFTALWTRAEALAKLYGRSIFDVPSLDPSTARLETIYCQDYIYTIATFR